MKQIYLKDGKVELIIDEKDFKDVIENYLGTDAADLFNDFLKIKPQPEGDNYERIADGYRNYIIDIMNELQEIVYAKRLNRNKLEKLYLKIDRDM